MPSRRALLAAGGTAATTTLAGCSSGQDRTGWTVDYGRDIRPDDASVVARTRTERTDCPHGAVVFETVGYDVGANDLAVLTEVDVVPGTNVTDCDSGWGQEGVDVTHDWAGVAPDADAAATWASNVIPTDQAGAAYHLTNKSERDTARWEVRTAAPESTAPYEFRSTFGPADDVGPGDDLADVSVEVPLSGGGFLGGSETFSLSATLTYGERE